MTFVFDNSYARDLEGFYVVHQGDAVPDPRVLRLNAGLARDLGLDPDALMQEAQALTGAKAPVGASPLAMAYAGHQFGGFSPQLGDGRALLLGEIVTPSGQRVDLHLKGSGRTPFSRGGDGKAVLGPVLREFLMGEAMHALGIPTTRALAVCTTGESIMRNGREPGAVLARIASSHLRVGTFQFFASRREVGQLRQLLAYAIARHDPDLAPDDALGFLSRVIARQASLIGRWMQVGFVHGVMNTDNMALSGETIDYGPCAFIDIYDPRAVFSSIDHQGRYALGNQPGIAQWNLARFAETLLPLMGDEAVAIEKATEALAAFAPLYEVAWLTGMRTKLGFATEEQGDLALAEGLYTAMEGQSVDPTAFFRALCRVAGGDARAAHAHFTDPAVLDPWLAQWQARILRDPLENRVARMKAVNPVYIPRNHLVEAALVAAGQGDMQPFDDLLEVLTDPFTERAGKEVYAEAAPESFGDYTTFCGT
jgi:uncharacterized protein YdiU (UPF0061 family)